MWAYSPHGLRLGRVPVGFTHCDRPYLGEGTLGLSPVYSLVSCDLPDIHSSDLISD